MRYVVHGVVYGLCAQICAMAATTDGSIASGVGKPSILIVHGAVHDASTHLLKCGVRRGMQGEVAKRLAPAARFVELPELKGKDLLEAVWELLYRRTPWIETRGMQVVFALGGEDFGVEDCEREVSDFLSELSKRYPGDEWCFKAGIGSDATISTAVLRGLLRKRTDVRRIRVAQHEYGLALDEQALVAQAPLADLAGELAPSTRKRAALLGLRNVGDVARVSGFDLRRHFGKDALHLQALAQGERRRTVRVNYPPRVLWVHWRCESLRAQDAEGVLRVLAGELEKQLATLGLCAQRLFLRWQGERTAGKAAVTKVKAVGSRVGGAADEQLAKPVVHADGIADKAMRILARAGYGRLAELSIGLGELCAPASRQLAWEWDVSHDVLCEPSWPRDGGIERLCEQIASRFGPNGLRQGCTPDERTVRLWRVDAFVSRGVM